MIPNININWTVPDFSTLSWNDGVADVDFSVTAQGPNNTSSNYQGQVKINIGANRDPGSVTVEDALGMIRAQLARDRDADLDRPIAHGIIQKLQMDIVEALTSDVEITWSVASLIRDVATGVVKQIIFTVITQHPGPPNHIESMQDLVTIDGDPAAPGFVAYENLTEPQVLAWVKETLEYLPRQSEGLRSIRAMECNLRARHYMRLHHPAPVIKAGLPWK